MDHVYCDTTWSVYWDHTQSGHELDDQVVMIEGHFSAISFTYHELVNHRDDCISQILETFEMMNRKDLNEVEHALDDFLDNVETEF